MLRDSQVRQIGLFLAWSIPLGLGILAASPEPYWLDSPEFTAAAQTLGIPHPPGHPLYVILTKPFTLLPFGGIAFRVALASAVFNSLAAALLYATTLRVLDALQSSSPLILRATIATASTLLVVTTPGWWFQSVRAEVYSLQIFVVLAALYPLLDYCLSRRDGAAGRLYVAAFFAGLALTNHHYIMVVCLPAGIPLLVAETKARGMRGTLFLILRLLSVGAFALLPYLFLPIRSASHAAVSLGGVHSLRDFFWVVSAKVYQKSMAQDHMEALDSRSLDALFSMMGQLGPVLIIAGILGLFLLLRIRATRMGGLSLLLLTGVTLLLRAVMGFDPFNPDYYGYMLPTLAGFGIGLSAFLLLIMEAVRTQASKGRMLTTILAIGISLYPIWRIRETHQEVDLSEFRATRLLADMTFRNAPENTLILTSYYKHFFVLWSQRFIDGSRPDIFVVNPQLFGYPGYLRSVLQTRPDLKPLAQAMLVKGHYTEPVVAGLAWSGNVRTEPDLWIPSTVHPYMLPDGPTYIVSPEPLSLSDVTAAMENHLAKWRLFYHLIGPGWRENETRRMLIWCHYLDAIFLAKQGEFAGARAVLKMAEAHGNQAPEMEGLVRALSENESGPLDVSPFLPGNAPLNTRETEDEGD